MFSTALVLKQKNDDLILSTPIWLRGCLLLISLLLGVGMGIADTRPGWIPIIIALICLVGALYREKWCFSREAGCVEYMHGVFPVNHRKVWKFTELDCFSLTGTAPVEEKFARGRKTLLQFHIADKSGNARTIDIANGRTRGQELLTYAQKIADYCNLPLNRD